MLTKEYRICLPMSVEEYRIAQLYMIQKKSREESSGAGSGVEILINEPYEDGPGGSGQYTHKVYHIGSHLPGWFRAVLPKSALMVEEEAWNAYPYTRTIYRCPFIEKFTLFIETKYQNDGGDQDNIFELTGSELRNRVVDFIDIVQDPISSGDYRKEEDPTIYISEKTGRGPLNDNWRKEYAAGMKDNHNGGAKSIMCSYKLCKVEFRYWGMQSKIERFIHDIGLRKTMLRAHRQAWTWQDEYYGLTMEDIRELERQTQEALRAKYDAAFDPESQCSNLEPKTTRQLADTDDKNSQSNVSIATLTSSSTADENFNQNLESSQISSVTHSENKDKQLDHSTLQMNDKKRLSAAGARMRESWHSVKAEKPASREQLDWRVGSIEKLQTSSEDEEFFDAQDSIDDIDGPLPKVDSKLMRSSSFDYLPSASSHQTPQPNADVGMKFQERMDSIHGASPLDPGMSSHPGTHYIHCKTTLLFLVLHGGSTLETGNEVHQSKHTDVSTLKATFGSVISAHYPSLKGHVGFRLVSCPFLCANTLSVLSSLAPGNFDARAASSASLDKTIVTNENFPLSAVPLFATGSADYTDSVFTTISKLNSVYADFLTSEDGQGFNGQVCIIADSIGSIIAYDALCKNNPYLSTHNGASHHGSQDALHETDQSDSDQVSGVKNVEPIKKVSLSNPDLTVTDESPVQKIGHNTHVKLKGQDSNQGYTQNPPVSPKVQMARQTISCPNSRRTSSGSSLMDVGKFDFEVSDFFMFGSPLALVLAYRKFAISAEYKNITLPRPSCHHIYNVFYPCDLSALRLEPVIIEKFRHVAPIKIPRYQKFPLGDGCPIHVVETIQSNIALFRDSTPPSPSYRSDSQESARLYERRISNLSVSSQVSGTWDPDIASLANLTNRWWGTKRMDFALYSPEAICNLPHTALPFLLHSSFWESMDAVAFILRQVVRQDLVESGDALADNGIFTPSQPLEKWQKRRTTIKLRNVAPNHRANDIIVLEDKEQILTARFMYGPLDMVSLTGEKVDIHVMKNAPSGDWTYMATETTDSNGRATHTIPTTKRLPQGMYPVKMIVRGDHTCVDFYLTVVPPKTEAVVFSIDGAFTASVSIMGKDPKVRPAAVDVVRHWQELGYMLIYVTARPDMQQRKVLAWLAQHNFPHGMVTFMDGLSADPIRQKLNFLKHVVQEADINIQAAYGSAKDIFVYQQLNLQRAQIFIVGKASKKQFKEAQVLSEGYASHLEDLSRAGASRQATGNARFFLRKSCFSLPGQTTKLKSGKKVVRKTLSMPGRGSKRDMFQKCVVVSESGNTVLDPGCTIQGAGKARGAPPRPKITITSRTDSKT